MPLASSTTPARTKSAPVPRTKLPRTVRIDGSTVTKRDAAELFCAKLAYGAKPGMVEQVRAVGPWVWLKAQLAPTSVADPVSSRIDQLYPATTFSIVAAKVAIDAGTVAPWQLEQQLQQVIIGRAAFSTRQVFEVLSEFFSDHLNVAIPGDSTGECRAHYERTVIRANALGKFSDMLATSMRHPAMLRYLDNAFSDAVQPNENYGRELLELHTVGVDGGYDQSDVVDASRLLSGLTTWWDWDSPRPELRGTFRYDQARHWTGPVDIMGFTRTTTIASAPADVTAFAQFLATRPATANRLARKLCIRLVSDNPPQALVDKAAAVYLAKGTAIIPMFWAIVTSPEFLSSAGTKYRRPFEDMIASVRATGLRPGTSDSGFVGALESLLWNTYTMGHAPRNWHPPDGFPDVAVAWQGAAGQIARWNSHVVVVAGWGLDTGLTGFAKDNAVTWFKSFGKTLVVGYAGINNPSTHGWVIQTAATRILGRQLLAPEMAACLAMFGKQATDPVGEWDEIWRWSLFRLITFMLDLPTFATR